MTAVAVQQRNPRQPHNQRQSPQPSSRSHPQTPQGQSYNSITASGTQPQAPQTTAQSTSVTESNGVVNTASSRSAAHNDSRRAGGANGVSAVAPQNTMAYSATNGASVAMNGNIERRLSDVAMAPHRRNQSSSALSRRNAAQEDSEQEQEIVIRRSKPLLQRAKSDYGPRVEDSDENDSDSQDWSARHGFEDHYASEEYVSQLANVSRSFHFLWRSALYPSICQVRGRYTCSDSPDLSLEFGRIKRCAARYGSKIEPRSRWGFLP